MKKRGLTNLELIIAIGILILISAISFTVFTNFRQNSQLVSSHSTIVGMLDEARSKTLSSEGRQEHGVHFESSQVIMFEGTTYISSDPNNEIYTLPNLVTINNINLIGGVSDLYFERLTGFASASGTVIVELKNNASENKIINISSSGAIE